MTYYPHQVAVDPAALHGQFILTTREEILPRGWKTLQHGRWTLACNTPLECVPVRDTSGRTIGWILGSAVTTDGRLLHPLAQPALIASPGVDFGVLMDGLCGRFLGIDLSGADPVIHPDPTGTLASVFAPEEDAVGSTGSMIPVSARTPFAIDWILATDIPYADVNYPLGLTPRRGVERILPNHVLDLGDWRHRRRWPLGGWTRDASAEIATREALDTIRRSLHAVHEVWDLDLTLTAGRDSRLMLACMRGLPRVTSYTFYIGDELSWRDVRGAREVATRAGIPHRVLQRRKVRSSQLRDWVVRTGGEAGEPRGWIASASLEAQQERRAMITGAQADFSRVQAFRKRFLDKPITPRDILARCHAPGLPDFIRRAEEWIGALPPLDYLGVGDLVMVEQRFACWGGVINYGELGSASARICPANTRAMMETASRLPVDYRTASRLHEDVIAAAWPELLEVPFNAPAVPPLRRSVFAIRGSLAKSLEPPARVWRKSRATPHWLRDRLLRASGLKVPRRPQPYEHGEPARDRTGQEG